jgi:hypothetical protein
MARSRNIKPGFFLNDELAECDPLARLLFAGLWTVADRAGRLEDRPKRIKAAVLPYDNCNLESLLAELATRSFIVRYEIDGQRYIQIASWDKHQQPHYKEVASVIPPPPGHTDTANVAFDVPEEQRERIMERDDYRCVECGTEVQLSIDHIKARSKGGDNDDENLRVLCVSCNSSKKNREGIGEGRRKVIANSLQPGSDVESTSGQGRANVESTSEYPRAYVEATSTEGDETLAFPNEGIPYPEGENEYQSNVGSTLTQRRVNVGSTLVQGQGDVAPFNLIPDSLNPHTDSPIPLSSSEVIAQPCVREPVRVPAREEADPRTQEEEELVTIFKSIPGVTDEGPETTRTLRDIARDYPTLDRRELGDAILRYMTQSRRSFTGGWYGIYSFAGSHARRNRNNAQGVTTPIRRIPPGVSRGRRERALRRDIIS